MTLVTEFRPVAHEFYPEDHNYHGAAFVGSKAADALWFYRYDYTFIEVRDIFTCQDKVFASLSASDIKLRFKHLLRGEEIHIVNVQDAYVGEYHTLVFVVRETQEDRDHVFIWNLLTLQLQLLVSPPRLLTAVTVTAQQAIRGDNSNGTGRASTSSMDLDDDEEDMHHHHQQEVEDTPSSPSRVSIQGNRRQLLVLGHRNGWVAIYKFTVSLTGQVTCAKDPEHEICVHNGSVTSFATMSNQNAGSIPVIVAGTSEGQVFVIRYDGAHEKQWMQIQMALEDLHSKNLPITSITLEPTKDESLALLAVGQGVLPGTVPQQQQEKERETSNSSASECPTITIYYLRLQKSDYRLLGYVQPPMMEGEVATGGKTLAATISEDANGLRIHCAFSIQVSGAPLRSNLTTVQIVHKDVQKLDVVEMTAIEGGTLLDISPLTNSYELMVLYLSKLVTYVHAADIEWNRRESEWAEENSIANAATSAKEREGLGSNRDLVPIYGDFFQDRGGKFGFTDAEVVDVEQRRKQLGGKLFYDRLLEFVDLDVGVLYPPRNHAQQKNLWTNIYFNGNLGSDNRNCLAYYLLKNQHGDASEQFLREYMIPPKFVDLMNGFWALDHFEFKNAVLYLSRPGLTVDWIEEVVETIYEHGSPALAREFIVAANLDLQTERFVELKMKALLDSDFSEAFYFQRAKRTIDSKERRQRLFTTLLDYCFLGKPNRKAISLLSLVTFTNQEEEMFIRYCEGHSGLTREIGQEFLIMYYVNHSRYMEAIRMHQALLEIELEKEETEKFHRDALERRNSRQQKQQSGQNSQQQQGQQHLSRSQKRQVLIDNLLLVLPETQRTILELEQRQPQQSEQSLKSANKRAPFSTLVSGSTAQELRSREDSKTEGSSDKVEDGSTAAPASSTSQSDHAVLLSLLQVTEAAKKSLQGLDLNWLLSEDEDPIAEQIAGDKGEGTTGSSADARRMVSEVAVTDLDDDDQ
ncbi:hypothetical protein BGZ83_001677 [Gryganskiella cystojenkinii]|nr:hypothetical protein BGZ83_001677 [Gryganskiella cystojenkinii]